MILVFIVRSVQDGTVGVAASIVISSVSQLGIHDAGIKRCMSARGIFAVDERDFPVDGSPRQKLAFAANYMALIPTDNDWPSWNFKLSDECLELSAADDPVFVTNDPDRHEAMIECGAALLYLKLALKHFGCFGRVELFPDLGQPDLVARVYVGFRHERDTQERILYEAMTENLPRVLPLRQSSVSEAMLAALRQASAGERGWLDFVQSEASQERVIGTVLSGAPLFIHSTNSPDTRSIFPGPVPVLASGGWDNESQDETINQGHRGPIPFETLAVIKTKTDDKYGWLTAGQIMARTILQAYSLGLSWTLLNPVRRREARAALRQRVGHKGFAQVILCFGPHITTPTSIFDGAYEHDQQVGVRLADLM